MSDPASAFGRGSEQKLDSWKEIASYLNKGVRTVVRWEKTEGLPVHRHLHERRSSVFAYRTEIDEWWRSRRQTLDRDAPPDRLSHRNRRVWLIVLTAISSLAAITGLTAWLRNVPPKTVSAEPLVFEPLTAYPGPQMAASFSPDGSHFAFVWNGWGQDNLDIYVQALGSSDPKRLTTHPWLDFSPAWSPDGRWIAFLRRSPSFRCQVLVIPVLGGVERTLADLEERHFMDATQLSWSPDAKWLAFADWDADGPGLFALAPETGERRRLTRGPGLRGDLDPAYSPDGRYLAFRRGATESQSEIWVLPLSEYGEPAGEPARLTSRGVRSTSPVWSGDGRHIFFSSGVFGTWADTIFRLQVSPPAEGPPERLTASEGESHFSLAASPQGGLLAYTRRETDFNIWKLEKKGDNWGSPRSIPLLASVRSETYPAFSPDGTRIAFVSNRTGPSELWVAQRDGSQARRVTSFGTGYVSSPSWSPDGSRLTLATLRGDLHTVWTVGEAGGPPRPVATGARSPSWSNDGRWIYYSSASHRTRIFKVPAQGGTPQEVADPFQLVDIGEGPAPAGAEGAEEYLARDGWGVGNLAVESPDGGYLFFTGPDGVWKISLANGRAEPVVRGGTPYAVCRDGLFLLGSTDPGERLRPLLFHRFADGVTSEVARIGAVTYAQGLATSPDCKTVLYPHLDQRSSHLMFARGLW